MTVIYLLYAYIATGLVFGVYFVFAGAAKIQHDTKSGGPWLRLLLLPASVILWPYLLMRVIQKK
jgi:hypothetical protein